MCLDSVENYVVVFAFCKQYYSQQYLRSFSAFQKIRIIVQSKNHAPHGVWKLQKKVSFNIASERELRANEQKLIKNAKNGPFWRVFENLKLAVN